MGAFKTPGGYQPGYQAVRQVPHLAIGLLVPTRTNCLRRAVPPPHPFVGELVWHTAGCVCVCVRALQTHKTSVSACERVSAANLMSFLAPSLSPGHTSQTHFTFLTFGVLFLPRTFSFFFFCFPFVCGGVWRRVAAFSTPATV